MSTSQRESGKRSMIKLRSRPTRCVVTDGAVQWETRLRVVRIGGLIERGQMTALTLLGCPGKLSVDVTKVALDTHVRTGKRERGLRVIEDRVRPCGRVVALRTVGGKTCALVRRIVRRIEIRQVATRTVRRQSSESIVGVTAITR